MTNYEKINSNFNSLFGENFKLSKDALKAYAIAMASSEDCEGCIFGEEECYHRHGLKTPEELEAEGWGEEEMNKYFDCDNLCESIIIKWLDEEYKEP